MKPPYLSKIILALHLMASPFCLAQNATWTGANSNEWSLAGNWNPNAVVPSGTATFLGNSGTVNVNTATEIGKIRFENNGNWTFTGTTLTIAGQETGSGLRPLSMGSGAQVVFEELVRFTQTGNPQFDISASSVNTHVTFEKGIAGNSGLSFQTVQRTATSTVDIYGTISDIAEIVWRTSNSILNLSASSSVSSQTQIVANNVRLQLGHNNALGTGLLSYSNGNGAGVLTLEALGADRSYSNNITFNTGSTNNDNPSTIIVTGTRNLTFSGTANLARATIFQVESGLRFELAGNLTSGANLTLRKTGQGTLILSGASINPSGGARVSAGTLLINGTMTSSASTQVTVTDTGVLGGTGTILRNVVFEAGTGGSGGLNPGDATFNNGIGTLTIGATGTTRNLTLLADSQLTFDLQSAVSHDALVVNGNLTLDGMLNLVDRGVTEPTDFLLIGYTGTLTNNGLDFGAPPPGWEYSLDFGTANEVWLRLTAVPEPGTATLCMLAGTGILLLSRRKARHSISRP